MWYYIISANKSHNNQWVPLGWEEIHTFELEVMDSSFDGVRDGLKIKR